MPLFRSVLKEYLVKIKTEVDQEAKKRAFSEVDSTKSKLSSLMNFVGSGTLKAGAMVTSTIMGINLMIGKTIESVSDADVAAGRFARRMWTTKENAQALLTTFDALDTSWEDLFYMTNEEFERFIQLKEVAQSLTPPDDLNDTLVLVRDIGQEMDKLQIIFQYSQKWFTAAFGAYAKEDLTEMRNNFRTLNDYLIRYLPIVTDKLAQFTYIIFRLGKAGVTAIIRLASVVFDFLDRLPNSTKAAGLAVTGFLGLLKLGPIGAIIAAILALLLLLDDFFVWQKGGKSLLGDTWQKLTDIMEGQDSLLDKSIDKLERIFGIVGDLLEGLVDITTATIEWADKMGIIEDIFGTIATVLDQIMAIIDFFLAIGEGIGGATKNIGKFVKGEISIWDLFRNFWYGASDMGGKMSDAFWDFVLPFFGTDRETLFGNRPSKEDYLASQSSNVNWGMEAAGASGFGTTTNNSSVVNNQTNNITVQQSRNDTASGTGYKIAKSLTDNRDFFSQIR